MRSPLLSSDQKDRRSRILVAVLVGFCLGLVVHVSWNNTVSPIVNTSEAAVGSSLESAERLEAVVERLEAAAVPLEAALSKNPAGVREGAVGQLQPHVPCVYPITVEQCYPPDNPAGLPVTSCYHGEAEGQCEEGERRCTQLDNAKALAKKRGMNQSCLRARAECTQLTLPMHNHPVLRLPRGGQVDDGFMDMHEGQCLEVRTGLAKCEALDMNRERQAHLDNMPPGIEKGKWAAANPKVNAESPAVLARLNAAHYQCRGRN